MFIDSLHEELILNSNFGYKTCSINYKGVFAYDGNKFHDLDFGLNKFNPNLWTGGSRTWNCIPFQGKTLFGGTFSSVGSDTLKAEAVALWDGKKWTNFPKFCFQYNPNMNGNFATVAGFVRYQSKLWFYGGFDSLGGVPGKNLYSFDGTIFTPYQIPVSDFNGITKAVVYKNKLIVSGPFYDNPSLSISRLASFDGSGWSSVGTGVKGNLAFVNDMVIYHDTLFIAGTWDKTSGNVGNYLMKWDGKQLLDAGFGNYFGTQSIYSMVVYKDRLYTFGNFSMAANKKAFGVAYYEKGNWTVPLDSFANYGIRHAVVYKGELYIAGGFKNINQDTSIKNLAKLRCPEFDGFCTTGVKENIQNTSLVSVFPNPLTDYISIKIKERNYGCTKVEVVNFLGKVIYSDLFVENEKTLNLDFLVSGVYFLRLRSDTFDKMFKVHKK